MSIALTYNGTTARLSDRLVWQDEYTWSPVQQSTEYSTTGAMLVDIGVMQAGRPITLEGQETAAWISRALCDTLHAWAKLPGIRLTLTLRGTERLVIFDHAKGGFDAEPIWHLADGEQDPEELFIPTLHFLEI